MEQQRKKTVYHSDDSIIREMFINQSKNMKELYAKLFDTSTIRPQTAKKKLCI